MEEEQPVPATQELEPVADVGRVRGLNGRSALEEVGDPEFPVRRRGYDREAVDAYVMRVNTLVAELEANRSPEAAVKRALDRVGEQTSGILQRANEAAEEITARSRAQAYDRLEAAEREARLVLNRAEARLREIDADTDTAWHDRNRIVEETRRLAGELLEVARAASERHAPLEEPTPAAGELESVEEPSEDEATADHAPAGEEDEVSDEPPSNGGDRRPGARAAGLRAREIAGAGGSDEQPNEQ